MENAREFKSKYILRVLKGDYHPFTPNVIKIDNKNIEFRRRNWHLLSTDSENLHFQNITGVTVDKHMLGATIVIKSTGSDPIVVHGFTTGQASDIKHLCNLYIEQNSERGLAQSMSESIANAIKKSQSNGQGIVADEIVKLKNLLDQGAITRDEYEAQKHRLLA